MKHIRLKNIKAFKDTGILEIKPLTLIVGENSSGKSSLIRFFPVLAQTIKDNGITPLLFYGDMIDYGRFETVRYSDDSEDSDEKLEKAVFEVSVELKTRQIMFRRRIEDIPQKGKGLFFIEVEISKEKTKIQVEKISIYTEDKVNVVTFEKKDSLYRVVSEIFPQINELKIELQFNKFFPLVFKGSSEEEKSIIGRIISFLNIKNEEKNKDASSILEEYRENRFSNKKLNPKYEKEIEIFDKLYIINDLIAVIAMNLYDEIETITYIGPFREAPKRTYINSESRYLNVGIYGENTNHVLKQLYEDDLKKLEEISGWFQKALGTKISIFEIKEANLYNIMVENINGNKANIIDSGYGISQVLPIVSELYNSMNNLNNTERRRYRTRTNNEKTLIIEQPELHLHPKAQSELADLFVNVLNIKNGKNEIIVETHSEHLIRKLQILIAQGKITEDKVGIYYVEKNKNKGAQIKKMELTKKGQFIEEWPSGFFDKSYQLSMELFESMEEE